MQPSAPPLTELAELRQLVVTLQAALEQAQQENGLLRQKLDALARRLFGHKSEQLDAAQLQLLLSGLPPQAAVQLPVRTGATGASDFTAPRTSPSPQRIRTPENLEVVCEVIEPPLVQAAPEQWKRIGQETSRLLDYQPGKFFWRETVRPKYVRRTERTTAPVLAPAPSRVADRCLAAPGLLAQLLVSKYADHLPYYRQEQIYLQRHGVFIARQQMVQWTEQSVRLLSGITRVLRDQLRQSSYVQIDETPVEYLQPGHGQTKQGYLWTALVPSQVVIYQWHPSRAATCVDTLLGKDFQGQLQCDGYSAYPAYAKDKPQVQLVGCWAHGRRGFFEAKDQAPGVAGWILNQIGILYRWEEQLRAARAGPKVRQAFRAAHSRMVVRRLRRALDKLQARYLPQSLLGQAIGYALNQWPQLEQFLDHGQVEIDNNLVENAIRPTAIGKKNWLFFGSEDAGERSAVIYTLLQNCRLAGVEPHAYLKDVLARLPLATNQTVAELTPFNWKKAREKSDRPAA
jgi:transposase